MLFLPALDITEIQFFELFRKSCENNHTRGVGTGNRGGGDKFSENTKSALSGGKVPFAFVKMFVQIAFFMIAIICPSENTKNVLSPVASTLCLCEKCCSDCILYDCNYFSSPPPFPLPTFP
jgi:hypothetical protein